MKRIWWTQAEELDEDQKRVLRLPLDGSYLIEGPPGSGKTNLIVLRAKFLINSGRPNLKVVVFTRALKEFIVAGSGEYGIDESLISTIDKWSTDFLKEHSIHPGELPKKFDDRRRKLCEMVEEAVENLELGKQYDTILIDEAQDLLPEEISIFSKLSNQLYAVADIKQKIYGTANPLPRLRQIVSQAIKLTFHYRNGPEICRLADLIGASFGNYVPFEESSLYDDEAEPCTVEAFQVRDESEQFRLLFERLTLQLRTYPGELIGILTPRKERPADIAKRLEEAGFEGLYTLHGGGNYGHFTEDSPICVSTLHSAKGLEFRASHMIDLDGLSGMGRQRHLAYTGVTRTKTALSLYHEGAAPPFLLHALAELRGGDGPADIDGLFGV